MFVANVVDVIKINENLSLACQKIGDETPKIGAILTDGERNYEVSGIPFVRYSNSENINKSIFILIKDSGFLQNEIKGKTLKIVNNSPLT
jgi:hypothetical protein